MFFRKKAFSLVAVLAIFCLANPELAADARLVLKRFADKRIILVTTHRRENFGDGLANIIDAIEELANLQFVQQVEFARDELNERAAFALKQPFSKFGTTEIFDYGYSSDQVEMLETDYLHEQDLTGQNLVIAVLDAGFPNVKQLAAFERMRDKGYLLGGYDFTHRSENFDKPELSNHGTLVLSTMAGYVPGYLIGTAPDANYYLFCTEVAESETPVEESYWVEAAERADSLGVDLINSSLSYSLFDDPGYNYRFEDMNGQTSFVSRGANIATEKAF